jgi:hypothetical protein
LKVSIPTAEHVTSFHASCCDGRTFGVSKLDETSELMMAAGGSYFFFLFHRELATQDARIWGD